MLYTRQQHTKCVISRNQKRTHHYNVVVIIIFLYTYTRKNTNVCMFIIYLSFSNNKKKVKNHDWIKFYNP